MVGNCLGITFQFWFKTPPFSSLCNYSLHYLTQTINFPTQVRKLSEFSFLISRQLRYKTSKKFSQDVLTHFRTIPFIPGAKMWYLLYVIELVSPSVSCEISPRQTSASRATEEAKSIALLAAETPLLFNTL